MPRVVDAAVLAAFRTPNPSHLGLVEVTTGYSVTPFIRRTDRDYDVTFGSVVYSAIAPEFGQITVEPHTNQGGLDLRIPDTDGAIAAIVATGAYFRGTRVRIFVSDAVVVAANPTTEKGMLSSYNVESARIEDGVAVFKCRSMVSVFGIDLPRRRFTRTDFPGLPPEQ